ncbi:LysR family transcriptional regulator [Oricola thermophila]|uniref:LysR family transcriptional regulator n=1 Tax=Oricola thermophila TaxID=2742145 RepID=A0A6N1VDN3_9HYPH|nr:LysR family transcriptional regulator [Oricola thermophila]QKV17147.1 LysR family transcriptional regulator [Oricola thermophila]
MKNELDLAALRAFHSVVSEGSFAAGARRIDAPLSTVSKRIRDLETDLGIRLIERTTRQMRVTAEGEALANRAARLLADADEVRRALSDSGQLPRGHLRIAVPQLLGNLVIGKVAALCRQRFPEITLEFVFADAPPDLIEERFDALIRFGPMEDSTQIARKLLSGAVRLVASPDLPGIDRVKRPEDISGLPVIHVSPPWTHAWQFRSNAESVTIRFEPALSFPSMLAARDAAVAGAGVTMLPRILARPEIEAGRLVRLLPDWTGPEKAMYIVYGARSSVTARLRAFIDLLLEVLGAA